jgi:hypothetical protein
MTKYYIVKGENELIDWPVRFLNKEMEIDIPMKIKSHIQVKKLDFDPIHTHSTS